VAKTADFWWPKLRTFGGHKCGPLMAISADFSVAMDRGATRGVGLLVASHHRFDSSTPRA
jgi:hypothetical protein